MQEFRMNGEWWPEEGMLLLVAVDGRGNRRETPCRVVGRIVREAGAAVPAEPLQQVTAVLADIGVPANLLGYGYLRAALLDLLTNPHAGACLTRTLYPRIARQFSVSERSVERAIRHAIAAAWARGGGENYRRVLGRLGSIVGEKPTNGEFLAQVAEGIRVRAAG